MLHKIELGRVYPNKTLFLETVNNVHKYRPRSVDFYRQAISQSLKRDNGSHWELGVALPFHKCLQPRSLFLALCEENVEFTVGMAADTLATELTIRQSLIRVVEPRGN